MTNKTLIYDEFLKIQADQSFSQETVLYRRFTSWKEAKKVLDFGCGNGHYTLMLANKYPDKVFTGVEINSELATLAQNRCQKHGISIVNGTYTDMPENFEFDFLILRFAVSYLSNRKSFWDWVAKHGSETSGILVIDADDNNFYIEPELPFFLQEVRKFYKRVEREGGQRNITDVIANELNAIGYDQVYSHRIIVNSDMPMKKESMYLYLYLGTEFDTGSPLPNEIHNELYKKWMLDPASYVQYGLFGSLFARK